MLCVKSGRDTQYTYFSVILLLFHLSTWASYKIMVLVKHLKSIQGKTYGLKIPLLKQVAICYAYEQVGISNTCNLDNVFRLSTCASYRIVFVVKQRATYKLIIRGECFS